jgi:hypothetical protein
MPIYFFNLKTTNGDVRDPEGMELADESAAWVLARQVARELMKRREPRTRSWRIDVRDSEGRQCFELLFASVDDSIMALGPELRGLIENLHRKQASLIDAISAVRLSLRQIQGTIARAKGKPFLISLDGETVATASELPTRIDRGGDVVRATRKRPAASDEDEHPLERSSVWGNSQGKLPSTPGHIKSIAK